jgi:hypothetical protein
MVERPLYPVRRIHLDEMSDAVGVWQHARGIRPNRAFGYCTDDVARALSVDLLHSRELGWETVEASARRSLKFLQDAFDPEIGHFRNLRAADGKWLDRAGSEDSHARALAALGRASVEVPDPGFAAESARLFAAALPAAEKLIELRPMAAAVLGCDAFLESGAGVDACPTLSRLAARLSQAFAGVDAAWPWPAETVSYENALLPEALIVAGSRLGDRTAVDRGVQVLDWLAAAQTTGSGAMSFVGNDGWWSRGGSPARFDQQPIEAATMVQAAEAAFRVTGERRHLATAEASYGWFLGDNESRVALADPGTGGCFDGLTPSGVNTNQGAESTLMWLTALEHIRRLRAAAPRAVASGMTASEEGR